ncbi:tyrosine-type recombinase/integrase [Marinomonas algarum]|uniref:Tyrosine-type recombinase/integrase n=1 Tax=Marinomonas algarum TaxID=2883105 RepID=A0A9X1IJI5_9GAMM|nr:tyrosine-type recombinase/integrase [Marinomonas algarum]MCB5160355.1 tyrosine-type recombinase/integrase [Marinomonas algarum]
MNDFEVIKDLNKVKEIEVALRENFGDLYGDIWQMGICSALRISELLTITFDAVSGDTLTLTKNTAREEKEIKLNQATLDIITKRRIAYPEHRFLFQTESDSSKSLNAPVSHMAVFNAFKVVGEHGNINMKLSHNMMRKTSCYHLLESGQSLEMIANTTGHSIRNISTYYCS